MGSVGQNVSWLVLVDVEVLSTRPYWKSTAAKLQIFCCMTRGDINERYRRLLTHVFDKAHGVIQHLLPAAPAKCIQRPLLLITVCVFNKHQIHDITAILFQSDQHKRFETAMTSTSIEKNNRISPIADGLVDCFPCEGICGGASHPACIHHAWWRRLRHVAVEVMAVTIPESLAPWLHGRMHGSLDYHLVRPFMVGKRDRGAALLAIGLQAQETSALRAPLNLYK